TDEILEERREDRRARGERVGEGVALAEPCVRDGERAYQRRMLRLLGDRHDGLRERETRLDERRELARSRRQLGGGEPSDSPRVGRRLLPDVGRVEAAQLQLLPGGAGALRADDAAPRPTRRRE